MALSSQKKLHRDGSCWHGKAATCLLYVMMILHVFWHDIPAFVSDFAIAACILMVAVSFGLYGVRNIRIVKQGNKEKRQIEERSTDCGIIKY